MVTKTGTETACTLFDAARGAGLGSLTRFFLPGTAFGRSRPEPENPPTRSILLEMPGKREIHEVEVKFEVDDREALIERLRSLGFFQVTEHTHEMNMLYDFPGGRLRRRGALLRVRQYGAKWTVTYKDRNNIRPGRHKSRREIETTVQDGQALSSILQNVGFEPSFAYEKFRSEWSDGTGHVVLDETPIGNFGEIEGPPLWIDEVAGGLGIANDQYITSSYAELFLAWKRKTRSKARQMLFSEIPSKI